MPQSGSTSSAAPAAFATLLENLRQRAETAGVFDGCQIVEGRLDCRAQGSAEEAWYRVRWDGGRAWVSLEMADRWQSESIEADLMHTGDKLDELLEEEMVDLGYEGPKPTFEHFRSDDMLFTFRSPLAIPAEVLGSAESAAAAAHLLLGYEACFRQLGDMDAQGEDD
jgi:hypothetical protein